MALVRGDGRRGDAGGLGIGDYQAGLPVWWPLAPRPPALQTSQKDLEEAARASVLREQTKAKHRADEAKRQRVAALQKQEEDRRQAEAAAAEAKRKAEEDARRRDPAAALMTGSGQSAHDCPECPEMVVVPAGNFATGSNEFDDEIPPHMVRIAKPVAVGKFEVTFAEWEACATGGGCHSNTAPSDQGWGRSRRPVINVSWDDAKQYVSWLSRKSGKTYRLLTEAEWEYAARARGTGSWTFGNDERRLGEFGWCSANLGIRTQPVGGKTGNAFGLHDMHGNVREWVEDCYADNYYGTPTDGSAARETSSCRRVVRGGSWDSNPGSLRSACRGRSTTDNRDLVLGCRVGRTLAP